MKRRTNKEIEEKESSKRIESEVQRRADQGKVKWVNEMIKGYREKKVSQKREKG